MHLVLRLIGVAAKAAVDKLSCGVVSDGICMSKFPRPLDRIDCVLVSEYVRISVMQATPGPTPTPA